MFGRPVSIFRIDAAGALHPCPLHWMDTFAMRKFTNDTIFDDTIPLADGLLQAGHRVPINRLQDVMDEWFHRKGYLKPEEHVQIAEIIH